MFKPNYAEELQMVYNRYGPINSTKQLSDRIINVLQKINFKENIIIEDKIENKENDHIEIKKKNKVHKHKNKNNIEIHSLSQNDEMNNSKLNNVV